jgi:anti-anti-sigma factor
MSCGKILYAVHEGTWVLRLRGDVRATWCLSLDSLIDRLLGDSALKAVVIDLHEATNIDSTMLGILARLAVRVRERLSVVPLVVAPSADVRRLFDSMCLDKVFTIVDESVAAGCECAELALVDKPDAEVCRQVADAHRVLMAIDDRNHATFRDVVATLEEQQREDSKRVLGR